jgi:hypothetical protein
MKLNSKMVTALLTSNHIRVVHSAETAWRKPTAFTIVFLTAIAPMFAQSPPLSPDRPWHSSEEQQIITDMRRFHLRALLSESDKAYSLAELVDAIQPNGRRTDP